MKVMLQDLKKGETFIEDVPLPNCGHNEVLIKVSRSVISLGTEKSIVQFGKSSYLQKAKQQPDKVKMVKNKIKTDGLIPTVKAVFSKLSNPMTLGYSNVGVIADIGDGVEEFKVGDRVISASNHSEVVAVNKNLAAKVPNNVSDDQAAFTVVAAVSMQGLRVLNPKLGETVVVIGLGLLGQIMMDLLKANGCIPIGIDVDESKILEAKKRHENVFNSRKENVNYNINSLTNEIGADAVVITAATKSNEPVEKAVQLCRKKGRVVAVGVVNMEIPREDFFKKELEFYISSSFGPGRWDPHYEEHGVDYPIAHVRWTQNRNFLAVLNLLRDHHIDFSYLISKTYKFEEIGDAYKNMVSDNNSLGYLIKYTDTKLEKTIMVNKENSSFTSAPIVASFIGAGNFCKLVVHPALKKTGVPVKSIVSEKGVSGTLLAKKCGAEFSSTDINLILNDKEINTVFITTRHNTHADFVVECLKHDKNIFVEKPLALNLDELKNVISAYKNFQEKNNANPCIMVGFNRRFSPFTQKVKAIFKGAESRLVVNIMMNAGFIPKDFWIQDPKVGGGRIIGEGCHLVDLVSALTESEVSSVYCSGISSQDESLVHDNVLINLKMKNGSVANIQYNSNGNKLFPKEKVFISADGKSVEIDNWKKIIGYGAASHSSWSQDKGHNNEIYTFVEYIKKNNGSPISFCSLINTTLATFACVESLKNNSVVCLDDLLG